MGLFIFVWDTHCDQDGWDESGIHSNRISLNIEYSVASNLFRITNGVEMSCGQVRAGVVCIVALWIDIFVYCWSKSLLHQCVTHVSTPMCQHQCVTGQVNRTALDSLMAAAISLGCNSSCCFWQSDTVWHSLTVWYSLTTVQSDSIWHTQTSTWI